MILVLPDGGCLAREAARRIVGIGEETLSARGRFDLILSGGGTPTATYGALAEAKVGESFWRGTHLYWGDERLVPLDDPNSNYRTARENLIDRVPIPQENIHPAPVELGDPEKAAARYEEILPDRPDLVLLGLGEDGHVASLFPQSPAIEERRRKCVAVAPAGKPLLQRITITPVVLKNAREVMVLVAGEGKAKALASVFAADPNPRAVPGRLVRERLWLVDRAAARLILERPPSRDVRIEIRDAYPR